MREGEQDGREYHFVSAGVFEQMARHGEFLEHNEVHGNFYGTARSEVLPRLAAGEDVILDIDVQGARDIREAHPEAVSIFIVPSSSDELERRLRKRGPRRGGRDPETPHQRRQGNRASRGFSIRYRE